MDAAVAQSRDNGTEMQFVTEADWVPTFWNYLLNLDHHDLIAELVQNDLDQDATRTVISFEEDRLVCEGNGKPVDPDGWQRLRKIQGAGHSVPAKHGKIGVKNHGLKTAFAVGDELQLVSAGRSIVQTLHARGRNEPPYPGASPEPIPDPEAPAQGCRITIWYRRSAVEPPHGEAVVLGAVNVQEIDDLFLKGCSSAPEQFAGVVSPEMVPRYEIVLRHWRLGEARFEFSCTRPRKIGKRMELFRRRCTVGGTAPSLPEGLREQAVRRLVPLKGRVKKRIPDFFRRGRYCYIEVSWPIDGHGKPRIGIGRFRYPIGYPQDSQEARTGHGVHFNAPFASDNKRHGPARKEATYPELRLACENLLIDVIAVQSVPRYGPHGLNPLVPSSDNEFHREAVRPLLKALAKRRGLPLLRWRAAAELMLKGKKRSTREQLSRIARRKDRGENRRYQFVIPVATWDADRIQPMLSLVCPRSEMQIDPRINRAILNILVAECTSDSSVDFITFDENDALSRITDEGNQYFDGVSDLERELAHPLIAVSYLDLIKLTIDKGKCDEDIENRLIDSLLVPDASGTSTALRDLYSSAPLPSDIPGLRVPPLLHPTLVAHPLFRRRKWRRQKYTMARFLDSNTLQVARDDIRLLFWKWLRGNEHLISRRDRSKLADIAIWPESKGRPCKLKELCEPRSRTVARVLADVIRRPHEQVRRSKLVSVGRNARNAFRRVVTEDEIGHWVDTWMAEFEIGGNPGTATAERLSRFEDDLAVLVKDKAIARLLKAANVMIPTLAQDGSLQLRTTLVIPKRSNALLQLPGRFMLKEKRNVAALGVLWPALTAPTGTMLLAAFSEDSGNFSSLQARLQDFVSVTAQDDDERLRLAEMPIIPVRDELHAPSALAFTGTRDYWGSWKTRIPGSGLSQDDQRRYREVGVISAVPNVITSRHFFRWLSAQDETVVEQHIPCVLRHILHREGPISWAESFTDTSFIPVRGRDGVELVSLRTAKRRPVFLSDAGEEIGDAIVRSDGRVRLVIDHVREVREPISGTLRDLGVRSLREELKEPRKVIGVGGVNSADKGVHAQLDTLRRLAFDEHF